MTEEEFLKMIHETLPSLLSDGELGLGGYMWAMAEDGGISIYALDLNPDECTKMMVIESFQKKPKMICLGIDRFTRENQGTSLGSLMSFKLVNMERYPIIDQKAFIVEYEGKGDDIKVLDINFNNEFWNHIINREFATILMELMNSKAPADPQK